MRGEYIGVGEGEERNSGFALSKSFVRYWHVVVCVGELGPINNIILCPGPALVYVVAIVIYVTRLVHCR